MPHRSPGSSSAQLAASLALSKEVPNVTRYGTQLGLPASVFKIRSAHALLTPSTTVFPTNMHLNGNWKEDLTAYEALFPVGGTDETRESVVKREEDRLSFWRHGGECGTGETTKDGIYIDGFTPLEKKWDEVWQNLDCTRDLIPKRVPLRSKRTKRCPTCQHILTKPEQKAQSIRFKIKLIASNYLPLIELNRKRLTSASKHFVADRLTSGASAARKSPGSARGSTSAGGSALLGRVSEVSDEVIRSDRKYQFELTFVNPLYEPINVRLSIASPPPGQESNLEGQSSQVPYAINLLASEFTIAAFAEVWEYDDEEETEGGLNDVDDDPNELDEAGSFKKRSRLSTFALTDSARRKTLHSNPAITKKANRTTILVEIKTSKHFTGLLQANMLVTFTYRSDELDEEIDDCANSHHLRNRKKALAGGEDEDGDEDEDENQKMFTFWTKLTFGEVAPAPHALQVTTQPTQSGMIKKKKAMDA